MRLPVVSVLQSADEYLQHAYGIPRHLPALPLPDEPFLSKWQEAKGSTVPDFLASGLGLSAASFAWRQTDDLKISFVPTIGGKLPVIDTGCHEDFRTMEAVLNGRREKLELPLTVNAFTVDARAESIFHQRVILLNRAPYSNIPAETLGLSEADWLERSHSLRLAHECVHYATLRLLGSMRNHALDEIAADTIGQIAAFGNFDPDRQRLFFGLTKGGDACTGRLTFYCRKVAADEQSKVYQAVDRALDCVADEVKLLSAKKAKRTEIFLALAGKSIAERAGANSAHPATAPAHPCASPDKNGETTN